MKLFEYIIAVRMSDSYVCFSLYCLLFQFVCGFVYMLLCVCVCVCTVVHISFITFSVGIALVFYYLFNHRLRIQILQITENLKIREI